LPLPQKTGDGVFADKKRQNAEKGKRHKTMAGAPDPVIPLRSRVST